MTKEEEFSDFVNRTARTTTLFQAIIDNNHTSYDFKSMNKFKAVETFLGRTAIQSYIDSRQITDATYMEFHYLLKKLYDYASDKAKEMAKEIADGGEGFDEELVKILEYLENCIATEGMTRIHGGKFQPTKLVGFQLLDAMYVAIKNKKNDVNEDLE